jgi:quinol monooxygenase YgiN
MSVLVRETALAQHKEEKLIYGLIGSITAAPGRRDELIGILVNACSQMPGCLSYIVAKDSNDKDTIWVTEVWQSKESHDASLGLPSVKSAISAAKPMIASFGRQVATIPVGGFGLPG